MVILQWRFEQVMESLTSATYSSLSVGIWEKISLAGVLVVDSVGSQSDQEH